MKCSFSRPRLTVLIRLASSSRPRCWVTDCRAISRCVHSCPKDWPLVSQSASSSFRRAGSPNALNTLSASIPLSVIAVTTTDNVQVNTCMSSRAEAREGLAILDRQLADPLGELNAYVDY
ncbi:hypothetical protein D3C71_1782150 [compost metagenome]